MLRLGDLRSRVSNHVSKCLCFLSKDVAHVVCAFGAQKCPLNFLQPQQLAAASRTRGDEAKSFLIDAVDKRTVCSIWHSRYPRHVPPSEWTRIASGGVSPRTGASKIASSFEGLLYGFLLQLASNTHCIDSCSTARSTHHRQHKSCA